VASYTAQDFLGLTGLTRDDLSLANTEKVINVALGLLNLYQAGLMEKMTGTAGNKSLNADGPQWAAICHVSNMIYIDFQEDAGGDMDVEGLSLRARSLLVKKETLEIIQSLAAQCATIGRDPYKNIRLV